MNPKLAVLYKEMKWLRVLIDDIGNPSIVKVKRLDSTSITRATGQLVKNDDHYLVEGYFFDARGWIISPIEPQKPIGILNNLKNIYRLCACALRGGRQDYITVEEALTQCATRDSVRFVVLYGNHPDDCMQNSLYVYKMPDGITASELLRRVEVERISDDAKTTLRC